MGEQLGGGLTGGGQHHRVGRPRPRRGRSADVAAAVSALLLAVLVVQVYRVHAQTGDVRLWRSATPSILVEGGRYYRRGDPATTVPAVFVVLDRPWRGAEVLGVRSPYARTVLVLRSGRRLTTYELKGGP